MTSPTLTISLYTDSATAVLQRDTDGRWRWFDTTYEDKGSVDMEISGKTAVEAMEALIEAYGTLNIDGDMSDHLDAARALDAAGASELADAIVAERGLESVKAATKELSRRYRALNIECIDDDDLIVMQREWDVEVEFYLERFKAIESLVDLISQAVRYSNIGSSTEDSAVYALTLTLAERVTDPGDRERLRSQAEAFRARVYAHWEKQVADLEQSSHAAA